MDLIEDDQREFIFKEKELELMTISNLFDINVYQSSIWDESLYRVFYYSERL